VVTGGNGLVGAALVRALAARGASRVLSLDLAPPQKDAPPFPACVQHLVADVCDEAALAAAFAGADAVFHVAAAVGPFFPHAAYDRVNRAGTVAVVAACRAARVPVLVATSSPTIKLNRSADVVNVGEDHLTPPPPDGHLHEYSRSKAAGTEAALAAHCDALRVCAIAPHQVYGKEDRLFLPALLEAAARGSLRIFGPGDNLISMCAAENAAHAHILAAAALARGAKGVGGEFFIISDTGATYLWDTSAPLPPPSHTSLTHIASPAFMPLAPPRTPSPAVDSAVTQCGLPSLHTKFHLSAAVMYPVAYACALVSAVRQAVGAKPLSISPFSVRMLMINRWFDVSKAVQRLGYRPAVPFATAWPEAVEAARQRLVAEGRLREGKEKTA
jgi:sterol-4alpha-carboxylate 3-dehydrogenase (decarboxylating)